MNVVAPILLSVYIFENNNLFMKEDVEMYGPLLDRSTELNEHFRYSIA